MEPLPLGGAAITTTMSPIDGSSKLARLLQNAPGLVGAEPGSRLA